MSHTVSNLKLSGINFLVLKKYYKSSTLLNTPLMLDFKPSRYYENSKIISLKNKTKNNIGKKK